MERQGSSVRRIHNGIIETIAGTGARGYAGDGQDARQAVFDAPKEMAVDPAGNIFIVDTENHVIRLIDAQTWIVTTIAGDGKPGPDALARPHGAVVGPDGAVYIGDSENHRVRKLVRPSLTHCAASESLMRRALILLDDCRRGAAATPCSIGLLSRAAASPATIRARWKASRPAPTSPRPRAKARSWSTPPIPRQRPSRNWRSSTRCSRRSSRTICGFRPARSTPSCWPSARATSYLADVIQLSDMSFALDFQKRGGYMQYVSPEMAAYKPEYKSSPEGYWTWGALVMAAIAYNPNLVSREEAPKTWKDMLDPKWTDAISVKVSISGLQHVEWYMLRQLYGNDFWPKLAPLKPHAFDSYVQQFDRLVNGQDKVALTAQYSGYLR